MKIIMSVIFAIVLTGCAVQYRPAPFWGAGGYSSNNINSNTVSVNYLTGRTTDKEVAKKYALYRCSELTLERGFDWFRVKEASARAQTGGYGMHASATYVIEMFKGSPPSSQQHIRNEDVYQAALLKEKLEPLINR